MIEEREYRPEKNTSASYSVSSGERARRATPPVETDERDVSLLWELRFPSRLTDVSRRSEAPRVSRLRREAAMSGEMHECSECGEAFWDPDLADECESSHYGGISVVREAASYRGYVAEDYR